MSGEAAAGAIATMPVNLINEDLIVHTSVGLAGGLIALVFVLMYVKQIENFPDGPPNKDVTQIRFTADKIHSGAVSFLHAEYRILSFFVLFVGLVLFFIEGGTRTWEGGVYTMLCFFFGAILSAGAGYLGMHVATLANSRTAWACNKNEGGSLDKGLRVAFKSGSVMGLGVVGAGIIGVTICTLALDGVKNQWSYISGFGFGASSIALFARVGGGVYTKAADVGADLVGKVESGLPEDHPFNSACIADNVGDNVGDVAGMGADLFESYVGSIIAAATLATTEFKGEASKQAAIALPFWIAGFGILSSIVGIQLVRAPEDGKKQYTLTDLLAIVHKGIAGAGILVLGFSVLSVGLLFEFDHSHMALHAVTRQPTVDVKGWKIFLAIMIGLFSGEVIGQYTEYCTDFNKPPTQSIAKASNTGPATVIIHGLGVGMKSVVVPSLTLVVAIIACDRLAGLYGVAIAAVGMLSTLGITLATDAYGPVADNAGGIAEMCSSELPKVTRSYTDDLDAMGNTTAATGKGFAIGSAVLTAAALMAAFMNAVGVTQVNLRDPMVISGLLIGAMLPYMFAAITMLAVGTSAQDIMNDVRDQFREKTELKSDATKLEDLREAYEELEDSGEETSEDGKTMVQLKNEMTEIYKKYFDDKSKLPNYDQTVTIATEAALVQMVLPGALAVFTPVVIGFLLGPAALAGLLAGALTSGFMLAVEMANAGGAWDNAKKWVEQKSLSFGNATHQEVYAKRTPYHDATVVGDTVGDPFKDTSGPALNVLIKLMTLVSLVLGPAFKKAYPDLAVESSFSDGGIIVGVVTAVVVALAVYMFEKANAREEKSTEQPHSAEFWKQMKAITNAMDTAPTVDMSKITAAVEKAIAAEHEYNKVTGRTAAVAPTTESATA
jgi:K(+)-stimulated pyrophosphate-energized sodium pump